jgi:phage-related protein
MAEFNPPKAPSVSGLVISTKVSVRRAKFEGGYSQRSTTGPNAVRMTPKLTFSYLSEEQRDDIVLFLSTHKGAEAFLYHVPGTAQSELWTCDGWEVRPHRNKVLWSVSASFEQEFDIR